MRAISFVLLALLSACGDSTVSGPNNDGRTNTDTPDDDVVTPPSDPAVPQPEDDDPVPPPVGTTRLWFSGFENGWPGGEWLDYGASAPLFNQRNGSLWNITGVDNGVTPVEGDAMYKGWITATHTDSHRAYPLLHTEDAFEPRPYIVNRFYVWADVDMQSDWMHLATWCSNTDWEVWTMSIRQDAWNGSDYWVELAHLWGREARLSDAALRYPVRQWVRFTAYIDFSGEGYTRIWMDGEPIYEASNHPLISGGVDTLSRAHWGMYAGGAVDNGVQYNDSIQIWALDAPLTDLENEPVSPYDGAGAQRASQR